VSDPQSAGEGAPHGRRRATQTDTLTRSTLPTFLTARDVADMLRVDERTVLRWAQRDASMPATRLGRVVRFEREPLLRWLARKQPRAARRTTAAAPEQPAGT
jgi:excisionase family DNA binding protein